MKEAGNKGPREQEGMDQGPVFLAGSRGGKSKGAEQ